ncbi:MAG: zinc ribbon domain-containing protein [Candidatus Bathyarchaeota archaeon]|nr:zinc ribbon domain-containing protein [Candidatus Bathyarchaeota archaeon]
MPYCEKCGQPTNPDANFCRNCGAAQTTQSSKPPATPQIKQQPKPDKPTYYSPPTTPPQASPPPPIMQSPTSNAQYQAQPIASAPSPQIGNEVTYGVILLRKMKSLGRYDSYAGVITSQRLIFAQLTSEMLTAAAQQARDQAKAEGKGFWGQWSEQLKGSFGYTKKYLTMPPQAILAETPGNYAIYNNSISEIKIHLKGANQHNQRRELEVEIRSSSGTQQFRMDENSNFTDTLKQVYGERVKMPFGYFSKSININF